MSHDPSAFAELLSAVFWCDVTVTVAWDLCEELWQAFSHSHCHKGVYAGNNKDN